MNIPDDNRTWRFGEEAALIDALPVGLEISAPDVLFTKIEDTDVTDWTERFGGTAE